MARSADLEFLIRADVTGIPAIQQVNSKLKGLEGQMARSTRAVNQYGGSITQAQRRTRGFAMGALQQAGFQIGDYAVQVANGTSKMQAFGQQGSQLLGIFGPVGALLGAGVAIFSAFSIAADRGAGSLGNVSQVLGVLQQPLTAVAQAVQDMASVFSGSMQVVLQNVDTALIAVTLFAGYMATKYVAGLAISTASTITFTGAMYNLGRAVAVVNAIMKRFLPLAIIAAIAWLIERFLTLSKAVGGFGEAFSMVKDVVAEAAKNIMNKIIALNYSMQARFLDFKANNALVWADIYDNIANGFVKRLVSTMRGAVAAIQAAFFFVKAAIPRFFQQAFNSTLEIIDNSINGIVGKFDELSSRFGFDNMFDGFESNLAEKFGKPVEEASASLGETMSRAYDEAAQNGSNFIGHLSTGLSQVAVAAADAAAKSRSLAESYNNMTDTTAWQALKDAIASASGEIDLFGPSVEEAATKAGSAVNLLTDRFKSLKDSIKSSMESAFMSMIDGTKSVPDAFRAMARDIIKELYRVLVVQRLVASISSFLGLNQVSGPYMGIGSRANYMPPLAPRAMGGPVTAGKPYLVGEKRAEIFVPSRNGTIQPDASAAGGGITIVQNNTFGDGVSRGEIQAMLPKIVETTKAAVFDAQRRSVTGRGY